VKITVAAFGCAFRHPRSLWQATHFPGIVDFSAVGWTGTHWSLLLLGCAKVVGAGTTYFRGLYCIAVEATPFVVGDDTMGCAKNRKRFLSAHLMARWNPPPAGAGIIC